MIEEKLDRREKKNNGTFHIRKVLSFLLSAGLYQALVRIS